MCFKSPSGGGNFSLSFLKMLPPPGKNCICNFMRGLKGRVKTPGTGPIGLYLVHKHLTQSRYVARLFKGPELPSLTGFLGLVATEYLLFGKNILSCSYLVLQIPRNNTKSCCGGKKYKYSYSYEPKSLRAGWALKGPSL